MNLHPSEIALLTDLSRSKSSWTSNALEALTDPENSIWIENKEAWKNLAERLSDQHSKDDFAAVISELLAGFVHSTLVSFDGGTALADTTIVSIHDSEGYEFKRFLHEFWPDFSNDTKP